MQNVKKNIKTCFAIILKGFFRWNEIISNELGLMKKFILRLSGDLAYWNENIEEILQLKRKFGSLHVTLEECDIGGWMTRVSLCHGSTISQLTLQNVYFEDAHDFSNVLSCMPMLEQLEANTLRLQSGSSDSLSDIQPVRLQKLKSMSLDITEGSLIFFLCLSAPNIQSLSIKTKAFRRWQLREEGREAFVKFLKSSPNLKALSITENIGKKSILQSENFPFKLKEFKFISRPFRFKKDIGGDDEHLAKFLKAQAATLEGLVYMMTYSIAKNDFIFNIAFKKLLKLKLWAPLMSESEEFYAKLRPLDTLTKLEIVFDFPNDIAAKGILEICPNIEVLHAIDDTIVPGILSFIAVNNHKLGELRIKTLSSCGDFENLKIVQADCVSNIETFRSFLEFNPSIETFRTRVCDDFNIDPLLDVISCSNIKCLELEGTKESLKAVQCKIKQKNLGRIKINFIFAVPEIL